MADSSGADASNSDFVSNLKTIVEDEHYKLFFGIPLLVANGCGFLGWVGGAASGAVKAGPGFLFAITLIMWMVNTAVLVLIGLKGVKEAGHNGVKQSKIAFVAGGGSTFIYFIACCVGARWAGLTNGSFKLCVAMSWFALFCYGAITFHFFGEQAGSSRKESNKADAYSDTNAMVPEEAATPEPAEAQAVAADGVQEDS